MEQKRLHMRIEDLVDVEFSSTISGVTTIIKTKTRDISAGGLKVYLTQRLNPQEKMKLKISLPEGRKNIETEAAVISSELMGLIGDSGKETLYETRFKFTDISAELKTEIIHYVYECRRRKQQAMQKPL